MTIGWGSTRKASLKNVFSKSFSQKDFPRHLQGIYNEIRTGKGMPQFFRGAVNMYEPNLIWGYGQSVRQHNSVVNISMKFISLKFIYL